MTARGWLVAGAVAACILLLPLVFAPTLAALNLVFMLVAYHFGQEALQGWRTWGLMGAAWVALWKKADLLIVIGIGVIVSLFLF